MKPTTSEEYYKYDAVNSGSLATFSIWDKNIRDEPIDRYEYWLGKCFEGVIREKYDPSYTLEFFTVKDMNKRIVKAIIDGTSLDEVVRYKNDGNVYKGDEKIEEQVKIIKAETRSPIDEDDFELIKKTSANLLTMEALDGLTVADFFEHAEFDVPVIWEDGAECKALFDVISTLETDSGEKVTVPFDLKYYASPYVFRTMFLNKLWLQERHYTHGLKHYCWERGTSPYYCMPFLVGYKDSGLTQLNKLDDDYIERADDKYLDLLYRYMEWLSEGKKETGHLPQRDLRIY
jgi:hypothetical protein